MRYHDDGVAKGSGTRKLEAAGSKDKAAIKSERARDVFNQKVNDLYSSRKLGSQIAMNLWAGPFANLTYNSVRASGGSKSKAFGVTTVASIIDGMLGGIPAAKLSTYAYYNSKAAIDGDTSYKAPDFDTKEKRKK